VEEEGLSHMASLSSSSLTSAVIGSNEGDLNSAVGLGGSGDFNDFNLALYAEEEEEEREQEEVEEEGLSHMASLSSSSSTLAVIGSTGGGTCNFCLDLQTKIKRSKSDNKWLKQQLSQVLGVAYNDDDDGDDVNLTEVFPADQVSTTFVGSSSSSSSNGSSISKISGGDNDDHNHAFVASILYEDSYVDQDENMIEVRLNVIHITMPNLCNIISGTITTCYSLNSLYYSCFFILFFVLFFFFF
jgi:hypothetical protein